MSQTVGGWGKIQRGELFNDSLKECEGSKVWPKRRWEKELIILRDSKL